MSNYTVISPPSCTPSAPLVNTLSLLHYGRASIRRGKSDSYVGGGAATRERGGDSSSSSSRERARERERIRAREEGGNRNAERRLKNIKKTRLAKNGEKALKREICFVALRHGGGRKFAFTRHPLQRTHSPLSYPFLRRTGVTHYSHSHLGSLRAHTH